MIDAKCRWVNDSGKRYRCPLPKTKASEDYCYMHAPLAKKGVRHLLADDTLPSGVSTAATLVKDWETPQYSPAMATQLREELDGMGKKKNQRKDKSKHRPTSELWSAKDFPGIIDGFFYQTLEDYNDHIFGDRDHESNTSDVQEFEFGPQKTRDDFQTYDEYLDFRYGTNSRASGYYSSSAGYTPTVTTMAVGEYRKCDTIMHMHYSIVCREDGYYNVWLSLNDPAQYDTAMREIVKLNFPCGVTEIAGGRFHTSQPEKTYSSAYSNFSRGGESFTNIRTRISRVNDPNWIPPNIRMIAYEAKDSPVLWGVMPPEYLAKAKEWVAKGCQGWYGSWHAHHAVERLQRLGQPIPKEINRLDHQYKKELKQAKKKAKKDKTQKLLTAGPIVVPVTPSSVDRFVGQIEHTASYLTGGHLLGCRMRNSSGRVCGEPVVDGPYCDTHNQQIFHRVNR